MDTVVPIAGHRKVPLQSRRCICLGPSLTFSLACAERRTHRPAGTVARPWRAPMRAVQCLPQGGYPLRNLWVDGFRNRVPTRQRAPLASSRLIDRPCLGFTFEDMLRRCAGHRCPQHQRHNESADLFHPLPAPWSMVAKHRYWIRRMHPATAAARGRCSSWHGVGERRGARQRCEDFFSQIACGKKEAPLLFRSRQQRNNGAIAQLGERLHGMQEVSGSIPLGSTKFGH